MIIMIWLAILGYFVHFRAVICTNMIKGTDLIADPYTEGVFIQKKPATTICMGIIYDEKTIYTSSLCEVGLEPVTSYHVVEAPHYKAPPPSLVHNIKTIKRGNRTPFDLKIITLEEPFEFCENCSASKVSWVETFDDYIDRFDLKTPGVVLGFGPPFKAGVVNYKISGYADCQQDYMAVRDVSWPARVPTEGGFCIYEGSAAVNISIPNKIRPVTTKPGVPCDDSIGSLVKINDYGRTIGILIKGFCGEKKVALGYGSFYMNELPFEPDSWTPRPTPSASTTKPDNPSQSHKINDTYKAMNISMCLLIHIFMVISETIGCS